MQEKLVNCNRFEDALDIQMLIWTLSEQFRCLSSTTQSYGFYYSLQQLLKCCCMKFINILFSSGWKTSTNILIYRRKNKALQLWSQSVNLYYYSSIFLLSVHLFIYLPTLLTHIYPSTYLSRKHFFLFKTKKINW